MIDLTRAAEDAGNVLAPGEMLTGYGILAMLETALPEIVEALAPRAELRRILEEHAGFDYASDGDSVPWVCDCRAVIAGCTETDMDVVSAAHRDHVAAEIHRELTRKVARWA